jgi:hypothetical protein
MNILLREFNEALSEIYEDQTEYISDKGMLEQLAMDYFFEKHKEGPDQGEKQSKMLDAIYDLYDKHEDRFSAFIDAVNLDPDFPLLIEYSGCVCEVCNHLTFLEVDVEWKAGVIPTNTLE